MLNLYYKEIIILSIIFLMILVIIYFKLYRHFLKWFSHGIIVLRALFLGGSGTNNKLAGNYEIEKELESYGYSYDSMQDIFFSHMDAWQRKFGYCRLYDEAAAPLGMIIDCEPIYFNYDNKRWLIEFWKGQYDLTTGCEVGVYTAEKNDLDIPGFFKGTFYDCAGNRDLLQMSCCLNKYGKTLFTRRGKHWWLTGFKLGEFSEPWELTMYINIALKNEDMCNAFIEGLRSVGYLDYEFKKDRNTVSLKFDKPHTPQPITRTAKTDWIIQHKNEQMCRRYQDITRACNNLPDKVKAVGEQAPEIYEKIINFGKNRKIFSVYDKIKRYLD